jgi:hypothetical protein
MRFWRAWEHPKLYLGLRHRCQACGEEDLWNLAQAHDAAGILERKGKDRAAKRKGDNKDTLRFACWTTSQPYAVTVLLSINTNTQDQRIMFLCSMKEGQNEFNSNI